MEINLKKDIFYNFRIFIINLAIKEILVWKFQKDLYNYVIERNINFIDLFKIIDKDMNGFLTYNDFFSFFKSMSIDKINNLRLDKICKFVFKLLNNSYEEMNYHKFISLIFPYYEIEAMNNYDENNNLNIQEYEFEINMKISFILKLQYNIALYIFDFINEHFINNFDEEINLDHLRIFLLLYKVKIKICSANDEYISLNDTFYKIEQDSKNRDDYFNNSYVTYLNENFSNIFFVQKLSKSICNKFTNNLEKRIYFKDLNIIKRNIMNYFNYNNGKSDFNTNKLSTINYEKTFMKIISKINSNFLNFIECIYKAEIGYFKFSQFIKSIHNNINIDAIIDRLNLDFEVDYIKLIESLKNIDLDISDFESKLIIKRFNRKKNGVLE